MTRHPTFSTIFKGAAGRAFPACGRLPNDADLPNLAQKIFAKGTRLGSINDSRSATSQIMEVKTYENPVPGFHGFD